MRVFLSVSFLCLSVVCQGCGPANRSTPSIKGDAPLPGTEDGKNLLMKEAPSGAEGVIAVRESAKDGDEVMIEGRIGGSIDPWVDGRAVFTMVDRSLVPCNERPGDDCSTPWDYCCDTDRLPKSKVTVKFADAAGKTLPTDARQLLGVKELQTVIVAGKAKRDDEGNLTVLAKGIYIQPSLQLKKGN